MRKKIGSHLIEISNKDKVLFPKLKIKKLDLVNYYEKISPVMIPHLRDRPIVMHRFPDGIKLSGFYQKNVSDYFPKWIKTLQLKKKGGQIEHVLCQNKATLVYLANQACITPHIWLSKKDKINNPDKLIFDLDPPDDDFDLVCHGAKTVKKLLEKLGLASFVMTTGSRGLHVVVPLIPNSSFDPVRDFARDIGKILQKQDKKLTIQPRKDKRKGRLFVDYLRNSYAQSSVAPYAVRPKIGAPVAAPLEWHELGKKGMNSQYYNINNIFKRLAKKPDPWSNICSKSKSITKPKKMLDSLIRN